MNREKKKVLVAMSGGVDSAVAAALLKKQGYHVIAVFMKFWPEQGRCCSSETEKRARIVAKKLGIPFYVFNLSREFKKEVVDYFIKEYREGRTPNPCVVCNKEIKFGLLLKKALTLGADYVVSGHYAVLRNNRLFEAKHKDQSYFLWMLKQKQLKRILFPLDYLRLDLR